MKFLILLFFITVQTFSQTKKLDTVFCDCNKARVISLNGNTTVGKTISPNGFGLINEISPSKQKTKSAFEKEHNSAWYKLIINTSGSLTFDIMPTKHDDDYDFMVFKGNATNFCDSLINYKINPIRTCISRDKEELNGKTGLNFKATKEFINQGIASAYCKAIDVKKGEIYFLVLDNVYDKGDGHTIEFSISQNVVFSGIITDENNKPIKAEIALTNQKGDTILIKNSKEDGSYSFIAPIVKDKSYNLNFYNDGSFTFTKTFTTADVKQLKNLKTILPNLKKGTKYSIGSINFVGSSVQYLRRAIPAMNNLAKLMKKNPTLKIKIIGHSNGRYLMDELGVFNFTKGRATSVKNYLAIMGIDEKRIEIDGKGDQEMLYPLESPEQLQEQNRRVEILVLEY